MQTATEVFARTTPLLGRHSQNEAALGLKVWAAVEAADLGTLGVPADRGGAGGDLGDACAVLRVAARFAPPIPLAETQLAAWLAATAGLAISRGPVAIGPTTFGYLPKVGANGRFEPGSTRPIPFAGAAATLALLADVQGFPHVAIVNLDRAERANAPSLSGEPWAKVELGGLLPAELSRFELDPEELMARGALMRANQIAGALSRLLELTVEYAGERVQFGRPIARFQAIQHHLADIAAETVAAGVAAEAAAELAVLGRTIDGAMIAKSRAGLAARAAAVAHQVHGAIGVTEEHCIHLFTRRIWDWRDDFGSEAEWAGRLGRKVARAGGDALWAEVSEIA